MAVLGLLLFFAVFIITLLGAGLKYTFDTLKETKADAAKKAAAWEELQAKYKDVLDLEDFKQKLRQEVADLRIQTDDATALNDRLSAEANSIKNQLEVFNGEQTVVDCGLYTPVYDFDISQKYKDALEAVREQQKTSLKLETAATSSQTWTVNGDKKAGLKQTKDYMKLMLRAFNGESDAIISNVKWNNVDRMIERLEGVYQAINKLGETHTIRIERDYFSLKLKELRLSYEYEEKLKAEKDEQRRIQEQIREEERVRKDFEKKIREQEEAEKRKRIENEQDRQKALLAKNAEEAARMQLQLAQSAGERARLQSQLDQSVADLAKANAKVHESESQLETILAEKERTKSRAEMTKARHVYIISNIGSFGENRFKIGMSRREHPQDRVDELSNASVPFEFDVHAMIPSDNAPQLEGLLHDRFNHQVVNLVNIRKEFFDVSIDEIVRVVKEFNAEIEVKRVPVARDFRQTLEMRKQKAGDVLSYHQPQLITDLPPIEPKQQTQSVTGQPTAQPQEQQLYILNSSNVQEGPYSLDNIDAMLAGGQINASTFIWHEGLPNWLPLSQFQGQASTPALSS